MGGGERDGDQATAVDKEATNTNMPPAYDDTKGLTDDENKETVKINSGDTKIEMGKVKEAEAEGFKGLTKDELMQYANDPFWVRLRWFLFILFWVIWIAMLVASIVIIIYAPKCPSPEPKQWWQKGPVYHAKVQDFPDTDNDNLGDLKGLETKIDYLVNAGVATLYLSSFLSPVNLMEVQHGSTEDWTTLSQSLHERGIRVLIDFAPTSTSEAHMWKKEALENEDVVKELEDAVRFWIQKGVDGLVIQEGAPLDVMERFRKILEDEEEKDGVAKVLIAQNPDFTLTKTFTGVGAGEPLHLALSGDLLGEQPQLTALDMKTKLDEFMKKLPKDDENQRLWPAFSFSTTTHGMADALTMFKMLLPGTIITKAGEEQGLSSPNFSEGESTSLDLYSLLAEKVRHQDAILFGQLNVNNTFVKNEGSVFGLTRVKKGSPGYVLLINFDDAELTVDLSDVPKIADSIRVLEKGSTMAVSPRLKEEVKRFSALDVPLTGRQAKIFSFVPNMKKE